MNKKKLLILITVLAVLSTGCVVRNRIKKVINKIEENESSEGISTISDILTDNEASNKEISLDEKKDGKVAVYVFRGEGCPHCVDAMEWFDSIKSEYGSLFVLIDYETWYNEENSELMSKVAESRGDSGMGVPYIIIGDKSWEGFSESDKEEIINQIKKLSIQ